MSDDTAADGPKITRRERIFADLYLTGLSGADAVREMSKKSKKPPKQPKMAAWRYLQRPAVKAYIEERRKDLSDATGVRAEMIVRELSLVGFANLQKLFDANGRLKQMHEIAKDEAAMLASVEVEQLFEGKGEDREHVGTVTKVRTWNKVEALEKVAKILGFLREKIDIDLNAPAPVINILPYDDADESERAARAAVSRNTSPA